MKTKILITGVSGLLGSNLAYSLRGKYDILGIYHAHSIEMENIQTREIDLTAGGNLREVIKKFNPQVVIHCAALADVEFCESHPELTDTINIKGTKIVVESIADEKIKLVYISTDSIYDGLKGNHLETDHLHSLSHYSLSKQKGELEALKKKNVLIARTSFFGWKVITDRMNFAEEIIFKLSNKIKMKGFKDVFTSFIYTFKLAAMLDAAIEKDLQGTFNFASSTSLSKYDFAVKIADILKLDKSLIEPISVDDFQFKAKRPKNTTLNTDKLAGQLGGHIPTLMESVEAFCGDYKTGLAQKLRQGSTNHPASKLGVR